MNVLCELLSRPRTTSDATLEVTCPALAEGIVDYKFSTEHIVDPVDIYDVPVGPYID